MALFLVTSNPCWRQAAILDNFESPYLSNRSFDPLIQYSAHRAVIFAVAQLSCRHMLIRRIAYVKQQVLSYVVCQLIVFRLAAPP